MSLLGDIANGIADLGHAEKQMGRRKRRPAPPAPKPAPGAQSFTRALGLHGRTPFTSDIHAQHVATREAAQRLPGRPTPRQVSRGYDRAILDTFDHQPDRVKRTILRRALGSRTYEGDLILGHVGGHAPSAGEKRALNFLASHQGNGPFDAIGRTLARVPGALREGLTPYSTDEIGGALRGEPSLDPQLNRMSMIQRGLSDFSRGASHLVDKGQEKGLLGQPKTAGIPAPNSELGINALKDALDIPAEAIPSVALPASKVLHGDVGGAAKMLAQPYVELAKHPGRSFTKHPLASALMVYGPASTFSRGLGSAGRAAGLGAFSTERAPATVPGTALAKIRTYHRDPIIKAGQVALENFRRQQARELERQAAELDVEATRQPHLAANFQQQAHELRQKAANANPDLMTGHQIGKVMDDLEAVNQAVRAAHIHETTKPVRKMDVKGGGHAVSPIAQSIVKPDLGDIQAYLGELRSIHDSGALTPYEMSANRALRAGLEKAIDKARRGKFDPARVRAEIERVYLPLRKRLDAELARRDMLPPERGERAALIPFAARRQMHDHASNERIRAQMEGEGFGEPAWITQAPNQRGAKNFYQHWSSAKTTVGTHARTGQATVKGTFDAHPDTLLESVARSQGLIDVHDGFQRAMREGLYRKSGKITTFQTRRQAETIAQNLAQIPGSPGWRVVNIRPFARRAEDLRDHLDGITTDDHAAQSVAQILTDALDAKGEGPFGIVPEAFANRMQAHVNVLGSGSELKLWRLMSGAFRRTVLATSPTWLAGNGVEAYVRTGLYRATPADRAFTLKVAEEIGRHDPERAGTFLARAQQGGLMAFSRATVRTGAEQFRDASPALAKTARAAGAFWRSPGPKQLAGLWESYTNVVFGGLNQAVELPPQLAMTGAYLRRRFGLSHHEILTSAEAVRQAAEGMMNTPEQIAMAEAVRRAYGQYFAFSPTERKVISLYTPFAAWSLNAVKFLYSTLPADHPALTALIADAHLASEDWRREHGLDLFMGRGAVPGFLQGSIPLARGAHFRGFTRYTPFGFAGDPTDSVARLVLPQIGGLQAAFEGQDWTGKTLRNRDGSPFDPLQRFTYGVREFGTALIPVVGKVQQYMRADGPSSQRLLKLVNPFGVTPGKRTHGGSTWIGLPGGASMPSGASAPGGASMPAGARMP